MSGISVYIYTYIYIHKCMSIIVCIYIYIYVFREYVMYMSHFPYSPNNRQQPVGYQSYILTNISYVSLAVPDYIFVSPFRETGTCLSSSCDFVMRRISYMFRVLKQSCILISFVGIQYYMHSVRSMLQV